MEETDLADIIGYLERDYSEDQLVPDGAPEEPDVEVKDLVFSSPLESIMSSIFEGRSAVSSLEPKSAEIMAETPEPDGVSQGTEESVDEPEELEELGDFEEPAAESRETVEELEELEELGDFEEPAAEPSGTVEKLEELGDLEELEELEDLEEPAPEPRDTVEELEGPEESEEPVAEISEAVEEQQEPVEEPEDLSAVADSGPTGTTVEPRMEDSYQESEQEQEESIEELLEEVEFDLFLSTLDLSGLEGYRDEDGFLEIDDVNWVAHVDKQVPETELEPALTEDEIAMLSDEDRERMEELQVVTSDDADFAELEPLPASRSNRPPYLFRTGRIDIRRSAMEELPVIADSDIAEMLPVDEAESGSIIEMVDGIFTINNSLMKKSIPEDPSLKALADSVLSRDGA